MTKLNLPERADKVSMLKERHGILLPGLSCNVESSTSALQCTGPGKISE